MTRKQFGNSAKWPGTGGFTRCGSPRELRAERSSYVSKARRPHCGERGTKRNADEMGCEARCFVPRIDEVAGSATIVGCR
jgi:hypothetical protein